MADEVRWHDLWALRAAAVLLLILLPLAAIAAPGCLPGLYGEAFHGSTVYSGRFDRGWYAWGFCKGKQTGAPVPVYRLCAHGECVSDVAGVAGRTLASLGAQVIGKSAQDVYGGWWDSNAPAFHCEADGGAQVIAPSSPRGQACAELLGLIQRTAPAWTPPPTPTPTPTPVPTPTPATWKVKTNGTVTTRPAYTLVNGVRGTKEIARAPVGALCDTAKPTLASGSDLWASYGDAPIAGQVALCTKAAP